MPELIVAIKTTGNNLKFTLNSPMEEKQIEKQLENLSLKDLFKRVLKALMKKITISYISKNNENEFVLPANCYEKFILNNIHVVAYMDSLDDFAKKYKYTGIYDSSTVYDEVNKYLNSMKKFHNDGIGERVMNQVKANNRKEQKIGGFDSEMEHHNVINIMRLLQDDDMEEIQVANMVGLQTVRELEDEFVKKFCMTILKLQEIVNDYDQNKKKKKKKKKQQQPIRSLSKKESKHVTWKAEYLTDEAERSSDSNRSSLVYLKTSYALRRYCETTQEIWLHVQQMMKGSDIGAQEKKAKLFNKWERFTSIDREKKQILPRNDSQQSQMNQEEVNELRAKTYLGKTHDPLALMAHSQNSYNYPVIHSDQPSPSSYMQQPLPNNNYNPQPSFNQNYVQQTMINLDNISDITIAMNMALALMAKAFKLSTPTNNNKRISSNPCNRQIAQPDKTQLLIAQKEEAKIQLQAEEYDLMSVAADIDRIGSSIKLYLGGKSAASIDIRVEQSRGIVEQHFATVEEIHAYYQSLYKNLAVEVKKVNMVNRNMKVTNAELTTDLARCKNQEKCFEISQEKYNRKEQKIGGFDSEMEHHNVINIMRLLQDDDIGEKLQ
ncbi:hypothetical protein Tco_0922542 [Tanacetum coccineum]|uniref:Uncharacterized protein n=1 Tax=Tanacetum coccineum TaxID=301880 RepID=A0ABQ5CZC1_9ASTR